ALADMEDVNDAKLVATALTVVGQHALVLGRIGSPPTPLEELVPEEQTTDGSLDEGTYPADRTTAPEVPGRPDDDANEGGEGAEEGTDGPGDTDAPADGTESSGGGATDGDSGSTDGGASDPESEG